MKLIKNLFLTLVTVCAMTISVSAMQQVKSDFNAAEYFNLVSSMSDNSEIFLRMVDPVVATSPAVTTSQEVAEVACNILLIREGSWSLLRLVQGNHWRLIVPLFQTIQKRKNAGITDRTWKLDVNAILNTQNGETYFSYATRHGYKEALAALNIVRSLYQ